MHEENNVERDNHVIILEENIESQKMDNFDKRSKMKLDFEVIYLIFPNFASFMCSVFYNKAQHAILYFNILFSKDSTFNSYSTGYDYLSIMHHNLDHLSKNGKNTMKLKDKIKSVRYLNSFWDWII